MYHSYKDSRCEAEILLTKGDYFLERRHYPGFSKRTNPDRFYIKKNTFGGFDYTIKVNGDKTRAIAAFNKLS